MSDEKSKIRPIIWFHWKCGLSAPKAAVAINQGLGGSTVSVRTVGFWFKRFNDGDESCEDQPRSGRPNLIDDNEIVKLIEEQPSISTQDIAGHLGFTPRGVRKHLRTLGYRKLLDKWVSHELTDFNMDKRVEICSSLLEREENESFLDRIVTCDEKWVYYGHPPRESSWCLPGQRPKTVPKRTLTNKKVLLSVWWDIRGIIFYDFLPSGRTVNSEIYCDYLDRVQENLLKKRAALVNRKGVIFHQDNARPHVSNLTQEKIIELGWETIDHPPYSPDLAPTDFHLFLSLQNHLNKTKPMSSEEAKNEVVAFFEGKPTDFFERGIRKLKQRWSDVISNDGDYF